MFKTEVYQNRRRRLVRQFEKGLILLLGNGESPINAFDNCYRFRQDSSFLYFCGLDRPGLALLMDVDEGRDILVGEEQTEEDVIWSGLQPPLQEQAEQSGLHATASRDVLKGILRVALDAGRVVHYLPSCRAENVLLLADLLDQSPSFARECASKTLIRAVVALRSVKGLEEIDELEAAADMGCQLQAAAMQMAVPGLYEWQVAGALEAVAVRAGRALSFPPIVTTHGEILHNRQRGKPLCAGGLLLVDCGVESRLHYASDHTRTLPIGGAFTSRQRDIYQVVLMSMEQARELIRPGIAYLEVHRATCRTLVSGLQDLQLMRGDAERAVALGAHALFMPHGLGHMLGLDVHDMEDLGEGYVGYDEKIRRSSQFGLSALRLGRVLEEGFVLTVEPGLYFIPSLIEQWKNADRHAEFINYTKLSEYLDFGGIRLEDDLLVTAGGNRLLGRPIPLSMDAIESRTGRSLDDV